ncbi:J domain-containing protein [Flavobacterium sp. MK4S-17]|jgi:curved DNA-binding protein CbpA|uniref:J domain-containing protein n=1 Tax=Flavobacterium sp. MK4S-17 TaxID=2543737 RepID=UPI00135BDBD0|nr:J domain-containing protein [Flavobacterium sp. MK4S-17]
MKNHYKILGVTPGCSQAEIKKAYRTLAVQYHPDKNSGNHKSEELFKEIAEAYGILGEPAKRNAYDYALGYIKDYKHYLTAKETPASYLTLFKKIKNKIFNSGGHINKEALFMVMDDILCEKNIEFLLFADAPATKGLIIDEILISGIFLKEIHKNAIYDKLVKLANGNPFFLRKIAVLKE